MAEGNDPAQPVISHLDSVHDHSNFHITGDEMHHYGLTKRELFAYGFMKAMISNVEYGTIQGQNDS